VRSVALVSRETGSRQWQFSLLCCRQGFSCTYKTSPPCWRAVPLWGSSQHSTEWSEAPSPGAHSKVRQTLLGSGCCTVPAPGYGRQRSYKWESQVTGPQPRNSTLGATLRQINANLRGTVEIQFGEDTTCVRPLWQCVLHCSYQFKHKTIIRELSIDKKTLRWKGSTPVFVHPCCD
jgi:hypothetical protein